MGQRAKVKNKPTPIYRSRQAGRTDIEELLGPAFNPHQRLMVDAGETTSLPRTENDSDPLHHPSGSLIPATSPSTVVSETERSLQMVHVEQQDLSVIPEELFTSGLSTNNNETPLSTVVIDTVVDGKNLELNTPFIGENEGLNPMSMVDIGQSPTVGIGAGSDTSSLTLGTVDAGSTALASDRFRLDDRSAPRRSLSTVPSDYATDLQWVTEQGQIVSEKQVRLFKIAQEVLNSNERVLYTVLWNHKEARIDPDDPHIRTVRAGYDLLAKQTNLAKKTIQRLIPRLLQKDFIRLHETPDFYNRVATSYQVFSYKRVLEIAAEQGRTYVAKLGHGIAFVRKSNTSLPTEMFESLGTVGDESLSTVARKSTVSVPSPPPPTVVRNSTILESRSVRRVATTTAPSELFERLENLVPEIDTGAVERIWREGREILIDIRPEEIAFWFEQRARIVYGNRGLTNPLGLLLSSIKDWLTERKVVTRRNQLRELAEEEQRVRQQLEEDQQN